MLHLQPRATALRHQGPAAVTMFCDLEGHVDQPVVQQCLILTPSGTGVCGRGHACVRGLGSGEGVQSDLRVGQIVFAGVQWENCQSLLLWSVPTPSGVISHFCIVLSLPRVRLAPTSSAASACSPLWSVRPPPSRRLELLNKPVGPPHRKCAPAAQWFSKESCRLPHRSQSMSGATANGSNGSPGQEEISGRDCFRAFDPCRTFLNSSSAQFSNFAEPNAMPQK